MRKREFQRLSKKYLLPDLPGFQLHQDHLVAKPLENILRAITYESSAWESTWSYFWVFVQPLYVPSDDIHLTFGRRLGGPSHFWEINKENEGAEMNELLHEITTKAVPFLDRIRTPHDMARHLPSVTPDNFHAKEAVCYSLALVGDRDRAIEELSRLRPWVNRREGRGPTPRRSWVDVILDRADLLRDTLQHDQSQAEELLITWREESLERLGLGALLT